jgi:hypothetical protein
MQPADELDALLDAVHAALRAGSYGDLAPLAERTEAALARLAASPDVPGKDRLRAKAQRNATCLQAAARGFRAARARLSELSGAGAGLSTYDVKGRRAALGASSGFAQRL